MLALVVLSLLPGSTTNVLGWIVIIAGAGVLGFFGNRLGDWVIILAATLAGAYAILLGLAHIFFQPRWASGRTICPPGSRSPGRRFLFLLFSLSWTCWRSLRFAGCAGAM
jgi:hypothetical protein